MMLAYMNDRLSDPVMSDDALLLILIAVAVWVAWQIAKDRRPR